MVSFTPLKTPEPSPELVYSEIDCQGLKVSPFPESRSISNNEKKKTCPALKYMLFNTATYINTYKDAHNSNI